MNTDVQEVKFHFFGIVSTTATLYYKITAFSQWERLPAANISVAPCCRRLSRLEAAPTKLADPIKSKVSLQF
jgi:hypothetical protein